MKKKLIISLILLIVFMVITLVYYMIPFFRLRDPSFKAKSFDQQLWIKGDFRIRGEMVQDLQDSKILSNLPEKRLYELLGPPDGNNIYGQIYYTVDVGRLIFGRMFPEKLYIIFNEKRNVSEYSRVD
jgi:hypothetical protein